MSLTGSTVHRKASSAGFKLACPESGSYLAMVVQLSAQVLEKHPEEEH